MQNKADVVLTIRSRSAGHNLEQTIPAVGYWKEGRLFLHYAETDPEMGRTTTLIKAAPDEIRIIRRGDVKSEQSFRPHQKSTGYYETPFGKMELETETHKLSADFQGMTGTLSWTYDMILSGSRTGRFELIVEFRPNSL